MKKETTHPPVCMRFDYLALTACGHGIFSTASAVATLHSTGVLAGCTEVVGTSSGSIVGLAYVLGLPIHVLRRLLWEKSAATVADMCIHPLGMISRRSIVTGAYKRDLVREILHIGGLREETTFEQLHEVYARITLSVCIVKFPLSVNTHTMVCNYRTTPSMSVLECIEASSQIPYVFPQVSYTGTDIVFPNGCLQSGDRITDGGNMSPLPLPIGLIGAPGCHVMCHTNVLDYNVYFAEEVFLSEHLITNRLTVPVYATDCAVSDLVHRWVALPRSVPVPRPTYQKGVLFVHGSTAIDQRVLENWQNASLVVAVGASVYTAFEWYAQRFDPGTVTTEMTFGELPDAGFIVAARNDTQNTTVEFSKDRTPSVRIRDTCTPMDRTWTYRGETVWNPFAGVPTIRDGEQLSNRMGCYFPLLESPPYYIPIYLTFRCTEVLIIRQKEQTRSSIFYNVNRGVDYIDHPGITTYMI